MFEQAMDRMSREIGAVNRLTLTEAVQLIEKNLAKSPKRTKADAAESVAHGDGDGVRAGLRVGVAQRERPGRFERQGPDPRAVAIVHCREECPGAAIGEGAGGA